MENPRRIYLDVIADERLDGMVVPRRVTLPGGKRYDCRVVGVCKMSSIRPRAAGYRFHVRLDKAEKLFLYHDDSGFWIEETEE